MRHCPTCNEEYEDDLSYCTFDGVALCLSDDEAGDSSSTDPDLVNKWKIAFFVLLGAVLIGGASLVAVMSSRGHSKAVESRAISTDVDRKTPLNATAEPGLVKQTVPVSKLGRTEILEILPKNLLRWFRNSSPDELRIVSGKEGDYIVVVGLGRSGAGIGAAERILVLKNEGEEFDDVTRQVLPGAHGSGVFGTRSHVKFDAEGSNLIIRLPASSNKIIDECASCEHAYQRVTLEWKETRYVEVERVWDNDRYTAFYVVAEALEKRKVESRARPLIDKSLDGLLSNGFARSDKRGWIVENLTEDGQASTAEYQLRNGMDQLTITVSKVNGQWRATRVSG